MTTTRARKLFVFSMAMAAIVLMTTLAGCQRIAPMRTLPNWVRGVYVPMAHNDTYEDTLEETLTRLTQEAFLNDGQLSLVDRVDADAQVIIRIISWEDISAGRTTDKVTSSRNVTVKASVKLCEPFDETKVIADLGLVTAIGGFTTDIRSVRYQGEPARKEALLETLASQIVTKTLTGFPATATPLGTATPPATTPGQIIDKDLLRDSTSSSSEPGDATSTDTTQDNNN